MADSDVNIVGLDGAIPPLWATEKTLSSMLEQIEKLVNLTDAQKKELSKAIKTGASGGGGTKEQEKAQKKATNLLGKLSDGLKDSTKSIAESAAGFDNLPGPLSKFGKALKETSGATKIAALSIGIIGSQVGKAISTIKESVNALRDLSDMGIYLEGDFMDLQRGLAESGMTIAEFSAMVEKNANVINRFGFKEISALGRQVNEITGGFSQWGLRLSEGTELTAELIDQQRRGGVFRELDAQRQAKIVQETMDRMTEYSKVLNVSRKEMLEARRDMMSDAEYQYRISQMSEAEREKFNAGMGAAKDAAVALGKEFDPLMQVIKETAVQQNNVQSEAYTRLLQAGQVELANFLAMVGDTSAEGRRWTEEEIRQGLERAYEGNKANEALFKAQGLQKEVVEEIAMAYMAAQRAEDMRQGKLDDMTDEQKKTVSGSVQTLTEFDSALSRWQATAEYLRTDIFTKLIGGTGKTAIEAAINGLNSMSDAMLDFADSGITEEIGGWIREHWVTTLGIAAAGLTAFSRAIPGTISALSSFASWAVTTARGGGMRALAGGVARGAGMVGLAAAGGALIGTGINNVGRLWGGRQLSTTILDKFTSFNDYDPNSETLSPEQQAQVERARQRRAEAAARQAEQQSTTTQSTTAASPAASPGMTEAELAQLSAADRQAYLAGEQLRVLKNIQRGITGDVF